MQIKPTKRYHFTLTAAAVASVVSDSAQTAAHQAPPSLGFSRREHWSGLPFPSPMHESEKWKWSHSVLFDSLWPHGLQPTKLLHLQWGAIAFSVTLTRMAIIKTNKQNNKCWSGCEDIRTLVNSWWKYKIIFQSLWKTVSQNIKYRVTTWFNNSISGYTPKNWNQGLIQIFAHAHSQQHYFSQRWNQPKCPFTDEWKAITW